MASFEEKEAFALVETVGGFAFDVRADSHGLITLRGGPLFGPFYERRADTLASTGFVYDQGCNLDNGVDKQAVRLFTHLHPT